MSYFPRTSTHIIRSHWKTKELLIGKEMSYKNQETPENCAAFMTSSSVVVPIISFARLRPTQKYLPIESWIHNLQLSQTTRIEEKEFFTTKVGRENRHLCLAHVYKYWSHFLSTPTSTNHLSITLFCLFIFKTVYRHLFSSSRNRLIM